MVIIGVATNLIPQLYEEYDKHKKEEAFKKEKVELEQRVFDTLKSTRENMLGHIHQLYDIGNNKIYSEIMSSKDPITARHLNEVINYESDLLLEYSKLVLSLIEVARIAKGISGNPAFMENLTAHNRMLADFVTRFGETVVNDDRLKIDYNFYSFILLHQNELAQQMKEMQNALDKEIEPYISEYRKLEAAIKTKYIPLANKGLINRATKAKLNAAARKAISTSRLVKIDKPRDVEIGTLISPKLAGLIHMAEETSKSVKKEAEEAKKIRSKNRRIS